MKLGALVGWGIAIYAVVSLAWQGLVLYALAGTLMARLAILLVLIIVTTIAARSLRAHAWIDVLPYSFAWAVSMGLLDAVFSVPFAGWNLYADWNVWFGYALVAIVPLVTFRFRRGDAAHA